MMMTKGDEFTTRMASNMKDFHSSVKKIVKTVMIISATKSITNARKSYK